MATEDTSRVGDVAQTPAGPPPPAPEIPATADRTVGVSGTPVFGGYVQTYERRADLAGGNRYRTLGEILLNTSIVAAGSRYFLNLVSRPQWTLDPPDLPGADEIAEKVETMLYGAEAMATSMQRVVRRAALYRFWGFSVQEWTAKLRPDGLIGIADVAVRPQSTIERWDVDEHGHVYGVVQTSPKSGREIYIPRGKIVYLVDDALSDSPEGVGLLRHVAEPARRLARYLQLEGWGFETDLRGIPVGRAPLAEIEALVADGTLSREKADTIIEGFRSFLSSHVKSPDLSVMLDSITYDTRDDARRPSGEKKWDVSLLTSSSTAQPEILKAIDRLHREIALILGVDRLLIGSNGTGSYAMARDSSQNFAIQVDSANEELREAFQRDLLGPIFRLNGWDLRLMPEVKVDRLALRDAEQVASTLQKMAAAGAMLAPDDPAIAQIRDLMGLSRPITVLSPIGMDGGPQDQAAQDDGSDDGQDQPRSSSSSDGSSG